jgi:Putative amidase domain/PKD domain/Concanavalin A-like lectin/glucanases superfamily/WD40-like Beta Propeller Repeat
MLLSLRMPARSPGSRGAVALLLGLIFLLGAARTAQAEPYEHAVESTTGLAHFWPMGESSGSSFADAVGGANAEVLGGVTLGEPGGLVGDSSTSALFNGSSGTARASVDLSGTHELTVEFWMKWSSFAEDDRLALEFTPNFNDYAGGFLVDPDASPGIDFAVSIGEGSSRNTAYFERPSAGVWHYYTFVLNTEASAATEITPYVDGHAVSYTKTESGTGAGNFANSTLFWMSRDASSLFGAGSMQDLALYDTTLSSSTIGEHYELGVGGPTASFTSAPVVATAGVPVRLDASGSSSPGGSITDHAWDFNGSKSYSTDGGSSATLSHTFSSPGTYTVDLRIKDSFGETATVSHTITVGAELGHYAQTVEETAGITHFWPMDESSGSSFADPISGADAEVLSGVTLGEPGGLVDDSSTAAAFNGSSGAARAEVDLSSTHQLTVEFWMKWKAFAEDDHLAMELTPNFNEYPGGFLIDPDASGTEQFGVGIGQDGSRNNAFFTRPSAEHWHYYAFTFDTTASGADEITPYVDGHAVSYTKSAEGTGAGDFAKAMLYWMSRDASTLFGAGSMQDLALYDTTLSSSTIGEHYDLGEGGPTASFTSTPMVATAGVPVHFDASASSSELGSITDYAWDFNGSKSYSTDGSSSATLSHTFSTPGTYTVDLRVKDSFGVTGTVSHTVTVGAALGQYEQAVEETSGVTHFWPMDESSGSSFADMLDGADASLAGGVSLGEPGGLVDDSSTSASFNGSSGMAHAGVDLSGTHKLTIEFWMKWSSYGEDDHLALEFTPNFNEYAGGFLVDPDATPGTDFAVSIGEGSSRNTVYFERPTAGAWHYYTFVLDTEAPAETEITPYIDGHSVSYTKTASGTGAGSFANSTLYWMSRDASTLFGAGSMQDLALYDTTLSSGTILEHYEHGEDTYKVANTTAPSIEGTVEDGQTLTANPGVWSGASPITYAYQWQSCDAYGVGCEDIEGATASTYTLSSGDLETILRVMVTATNPGGTAEATSAASAEVEPGPPVKLEAPSVEGTPDVGQTLFGDLGEWGGTEPEFSYQWERCNSAGESCADITGATGLEYEPVAGDVGKTLRLVVGASNELGSVSAHSAPTPLIGAEFTLASTSPPTITGTRQQGHTLTAEPGSWSGSGSIGYAYQWRQCDEYGANCEDISGATSSTYTPGEAAVGASLRVVVTATDANGSLAATSAATQPIAAVSSPTIGEAPAISGTSQEGQTLTASTGTWSASGTISYAYQWQSCDVGGAECSAIAGATASSYTPAAGDIGATIRVLVTATAEGKSSIGVSSPTEPVSPATLVDVSLPTITGATHAEATLTAEPGIWTVAPGSISYGHQWERCNSSGHECTAITGAASSTYTPGSGDVGHTLRVLVTATSLWGEADVLSEATSVIAPAPTAPEVLEEPWVSGSPIEGELLTVERGTWTGTEPISYSYRWQRCNAEYEACADISGATASTYTLASADLGSTVRAVVTAKNTVGEVSADAWLYGVVEEPASPLPEEPPVSLVAPSVSGSPYDGQELSQNTEGSWLSREPISFSDQWERCNEAGASCTNISGATGRNYTLGEADVGSTLRLAVTATNPYGSTTVASEATAVVAFGPPVGQTPVVDHESFYVGETLTAGDVAALGAGPISESYQWERCNSSGGSCVEISGATSSTYVSSSSDIGSEIRVTVAYTNTHGTDTRTSSPTWWTVQNHAPFNVSSPYMTASDIGFGAGDTITVHPGTWLGSHPISYAYQWESCVSGSCEAISGATASTYTVPTGGKNIRVKVKATNAAGSATEYARSQYVYPENSTPESVVAPTISGVAKDGETLTAHHGEWHGEPTSYSYQWLSCKVGQTKCDEITGATGETLEPTAELDGLQLTVEVTATNAYGSTTVRAEERTSAVVAIPPVNTALPEVTGEAVVGNQLKSNGGSWFGNTGVLTPLSGPAYTDQWQLCNASGEACVDIPEASSFGYESAYTPPSADAGATVRVLVSTRSADESAEASAASPATPVLAAATLPSNTAAPTISGTAQDGLVLTATSGTWSGSPVIRYTYQWERCNSSGGECVEIKEATDAAYTAARNDIGHKLRVVASAANAAGSVSSTSEPTGLVAEPAAPTNIEAPRFPLFLESWGEPEFPVYRPIHPTPGTWTGDPTITYEWQRCDPTCTAIPGATSLLYTPRAADIGYKLNLVETATNVAGTATSETGLSTDAVKVTGMSYSGTFHPSEKYTGATAVGQTITAGGTFSSSPELPITVSYEFLLVNEPEAPNTVLASGSSPKYTLTSEDLGHEIEIVLTGTAWRADEAAVVESDTVDVYTHVVEVPPTNDTAPTITGELTAGSLLTAHLGTWHGGGGTLSYSYQWQTCNSSGEACTNISEATSSTYTTSSSDDGDTLRVRITAANQDASTTATSAASGTITAASTPANTTLPSISGEAKDLQTLTASHGAWSGSTPLTYAYQWFSCSAEGSECYEIPGATGTTYQAEEGDVGNTLKVRVTATNAAGSSTATSSATTAVAALAAPVNLALPSIILLGTGAPGAQITTDGGSWQNVASTPSRGAFTYQWQRCEAGGGGCERIAEGIQQTYSVTSEDGGHRLRVIVTAQNESGRASSASQLSPIISETTPSSSEKILYTTANAIFTASVEGGESHELTNCETVDSEAGASACHFHHPSISPDGEMIATEVLSSGSSSHRCVEEQLCPSAPSGGPEDVNLDGKIALMNYDGSQARFLSGNGSQPTWSPDGTTITYTRIIESGGTTTTHLYSVDADGSNAADPIPIDTGTKYSEAPAYSPDGSQLAYVGRESTTEPWGLYVANADGTEAERLDVGELTEADMPQFSSDSNAIVFLGIPPYSKSTTGYEELEAPLKPTVRNVYQINTDGSSLTQITHTEKEDTGSPTPGPGVVVLVRTGGVEGEAGPGIAIIWGQPRIEIVPTEGSSESTPLPPPPGEEKIADMTKGKLGPHARAAFLQACSKLRKVCGQWTLKNTQSAFEYAHYYWDHSNYPAYYTYENDCTDYASQLLHAGGMPMLRVYEQGKDSWFTMPGVLAYPHYEPYHSASWVQAEVLYHQLLNTGVARSLTKGEIPQAGDLVFFHWRLHGEPPIDHVGMIVSGNNNHPATEIFTSHTNNRLSTMEAEYKEIGKYLHERNKAIPAYEYGRGKWWQWYVLRPIHLSAYVPPE